jgi:hypothetical protein
MRKKSRTTMLTLPMAARLSVRLLKICCMPAERVSALKGLMARSTRRPCRSGHAACQHRTYCDGTTSEVE